MDFLCYNYEMTNSETEVKDQEAKVQNEQFELAGFGVRTCADFIDSCILDFFTILLGVIIFGTMYWVQDPEHINLVYFETVSPVLMQVILITIRAGMSLVYYTLGAFRYHTSIGKHCLRIVVVSAKAHPGSGFGRVTREQSLIRCLAYVVSYLPLGAGFLMILFHPERKALHDLIAGTACLRLKKGSKLQFEEPQVISSTVS